MANSTEPVKYATQFLIAADADRESMDKLGLGGSALAHNRVFAAGMAVDIANQGRLKEADTIGNETRVCLQQIADYLDMAGLTLRDVIKITCYATDESYIPEMWRVLDDIFAPGPPPKRITLVAGIGAQCRLEFDIVAAKSEEAA